MIYETFTSRQVVDVVGMTRKQLQYLDKIHLIKPTIRRAEGKGSRRLYSYEDLVNLRIFKKLREQGFSFQFLHKCIPVIRELHPSPNGALSHLVIMVEGKHIYAELNENTLIDVGENQLMFRIALSEIEKDLEARIVALNWRRAKQERMIENKANLSVNGLTEPSS